MKRDNLSLPAVLKRIFVQRNLKTKSLEKYVDIYKVGNRAGLDSVEKQIEKILVQIEQKGSNGR
jgi:dephospho-CoA kinase